MKGKFALTAALWLAMGGTVVASALPETPLPKYPMLPTYPPLDETEARLQKLELLVNQQQLQIKSLGSENQTLRSDLANMVAINDFMTLETVHGRRTVRFNAVNLQVVNGLGHTEYANGLGNIVIGYDRLRNGDWGMYSDECSRGTGNSIREPVTTQAECLAMGGAWGLNHKGGSHYLVVGDDHNYTRWSGIVSGWGNTASSEWASVTGGFFNRATGAGAAISGGDRGLASGYASSITGGDHNVASGVSSSVSGGRYNMASGEGASVTGGGWNEASAHIATVSGGNGNAATGQASAVSGGSAGTASGHASSVSGGNAHQVQDDYGWAAGAY